MPQTGFEPMTQELESQRWNQLPPPFVQEADIAKHIWHVDKFCVPLKW